MKKGTVLDIKEYFDNSFNPYAEELEYIRFSIDENKGLDAVSSKALVHLMSRMCTKIVELEKRLRPTL